MTFFKIIWCLDAIAAAVVLYFFFVGMADGSVSDRNAGLWFLILAALAGVMGGSLWLRHHGHTSLAYAVLCIVALPALFYLLYIGFAVIANPRWN